MYVEGERFACCDSDCAVRGNNVMSGYASCKWGIKENVVVSVEQCESEELECESCNFIGS